MGWTLDDAHGAVFPIWRTETPKMKLREIKQQPTIYGPLEFSDHVGKNGGGAIEMKSSSLSPMMRGCRGRTINVNFVYYRIPKQRHLVGFGAPV
ncbi:hypothetical protein TNCV_4439541 [Trichonephila clavipes]|nr:hypothetical protein TNCV_4439541 [Trichonephila clavipes]